MFASPLGGGAREASREELYDIVKEGFSRRFGVWRDDLVKTSLSGKDKAHVWAQAGFRTSAGNRPHAWVLLRTIKRIRASDGCLGTERR